MAQSAVITTRSHRMRGRSCWRTRAIFCANNQSEISASALVASAVPVVLEPADDFVVTDQAARGERFVIMKVRYAGHFYGFTNDGTKDVPACSASIDSDVGTGRVK